MRERSAEWLRLAHKLVWENMNPMIIIMDIFVVSLLVFGAEIGIHVVVRIWIGLVIVFVMITKAMTAYHIGQYDQIQEEMQRNEERMKRKGWFN